MLDVVLRVKPPSRWVVDIGSRHDVPVFLFSCVPNGQGGGRSLFEVRGDSETLAQVEESLRSHPDIEGLHIVDSSHGSIYGSIIARNWVACSTILKSDCYLKQGRFRRDGWVDWELLVSSESALSHLIGRLSSSGCKASLSRKRVVAGPRILTERQEEVVVKALESGYYDFPRRVSGAELSKRLGVAQSTLSETLQRAERKLVDHYLRTRD